MVCDLRLGIVDLFVVGLDTIGEFAQSLLPLTLLLYEVLRLPFPEGSAFVDRLANHPFVW